MSLTLRVLAGLVAGVLVGLALGAASPVVPVIAPLGTIFINLIRMTVIPLVVSMLIASVGNAAAAGSLGGAGWRAAVLAVALLVAASLVAVVVAAPVLAAVHVDESAAMALRASATPISSGAATSAVNPSPGTWFGDLVPSNPVKAAADGAMLPLIVFAVLFALALARARESSRTAVLRLTEGIADAMQRLVSGILAVAPIGVFALAVPLAAKLGLSAAGAVVVYVVLVVVLTIAVGLAILYPVGVLAGPLSLREFIEFCTPAQAVAFASRTSLAALPVMVESAERARLPLVVTGFVVPLAASIFRVGAAVAQPVGVLFLARMYGVALSAPQLASVIVTVVATSFAVPGIPGGSIIAMVPVLASVGLPIEGIGILMAVDAIPDMFRTTENVTGSLALAAALSERRVGRSVIG